MTNHIARVAILLAGLAGSLISRSAAQEAPTDEMVIASAVPTFGITPYDSRTELSPVWMHAEYLYGVLGDRSLPALVTTSPNGTLPADAGVLGEPDTTVLIGGSDQLNAPGVRGFFGIRPLLWYDQSNPLEIETSLMWFGEEYDAAAGPSTGDPILARPFFDTISGNQTSSLVAYPGIRDGIVDTEVSSEIHSLGILFRQNWRQSERWRIDAVAGYRYFNLREKLVVDENLLLPTADPWGRDEYVERYDSFRTNNYFHGGEIGILARGAHFNWELEVRANVAIGGLRQNLSLDGFTFFDIPLASGQDDREQITLPGGFLTSPLELGGHSARSIAIMPQVDVTLYRRVTPDFDFTVGYTFVMVPDVIRLDDQVAVDFAGFPGTPPQPRTLNESDFFINALRIGVRL